MVASIVRIAVMLAVLVITLTAHVMPASAARLAAGEKRVALVIGNSGYRNVGVLKNAVGDAKAIASTLERLGFAVTAGTDLDRAGFDAALAAFRQTTQDADAVLFYYSGHAFQLDGVNHLVPTDAVLRNREQIGTETVSLDDIILGIQSSDRPTLIFLDACRNNPLPSRLRAAAGNGLARFQRDDVSNLYIAFATAPGAVTDDGLDKHSPFASALLENIPRQGISVSEMMTDVRRSVRARTLERQKPWEQTDLSEMFYFNPQAGSGKGDIGANTGPAEQQVAAADPLAPVSAPAGGTRAVETGEGEEAGQFVPPPTAEPSGPAVDIFGSSDPSASLPGQTTAEQPEADRPAVDIFGTSPESQVPVGEQIQVASLDSARLPRILPNEDGARPATPASRIGSTSAPSVSAPHADRAVEMAKTLRAAASAVVVSAPHARGASLSRIEGRDPPEEVKVAVLRPNDVGRDLLPDDGEGEPAGLPPAGEPVLPAPDAAPSPEELARETQDELSRLGCYRGSVDGDWGKGSADALQRFFAESGAGPAVSEPSADVLALLRGTADGICAAALQRPEPAPPAASPPYKPAVKNRPPRRPVVRADPPKKPAVKSRPTKKQTVRADPPKKPAAKSRPTKKSTVTVKAPKKPPPASTGQKPRLKLRGIGA